MSKKEEPVRRPVAGRRVGLAQVSPALGDVAVAMEAHRAAVEKAVADGCDLLVFPELSLTGYRLKDSVPDVALRRDSETFRELAELSKRVALVVGFVEESPGNLFYNAAAYFEEGRCVAVHRKTYLPTYGMFDEQRYFARGQSIAAFDTKAGRVAILVCEDMLHPSAVTVAACDGATLLVVPSASPARGIVEAATADADAVTGEQPAQGAEGAMAAAPAAVDAAADANARSWEAYNKAMARTFGIWIAYCNRVGVEDGVTFWGGSEIVSPAGERIAKAPYYEEGFVSAVVSDDAVRRRRIANPLVRDEDLDLTINELSRIRGRAVAQKARDEAAEGGDRPAFSRAKPRFEGEGGEERRPWRPREERFDDSPRPRFSRDREGFQPRDRGEGGRGGFGGPPRDRFGAGPSRGGFGAPRDRDDAPRPRFGGGSREGDAPRGRFGGGRDRDGGDGPPRGRFGSGPREGGPPRGRFGGPPREREGGFGPPRDREGGFGPPRGRFGDGPPRGRFGDGPPRGRFGDGPPRAREGGFGPPRGRFGDGPPPRGRFGDGPPRGRDDRGAGAAGGFDRDKPRERQRPERAKKPFGKGAPRKRKDD